MSLEEIKELRETIISHSHKIMSLQEFQESDRKQFQEIVRKIETLSKDYTVIVTSIKSLSMMAKILVGVIGIVSVVIGIYKHIQP